MLIIGSGGREHAIALKIKESKHLNNLFAIPGNAGIAEIASCFDLNILDNNSILRFCKEHSIDFVIIGPEMPLANGLSDILEINNIKVYGPNKKASQFESSKSFSRKFMKKYGLPTVDFEEFTDFNLAKEYIIQKGAPIVIKADGLAAGKGVCVAKTKEEAIDFLKDSLVYNKFKEALPKIIIEEFLEGEEASYHVFVDSKSFKPMAYSQDHKQIYDGDIGPNTGGMGAYAPAQVLDSYEYELEEKIMKPFIKALKQEEIDYRGTLFIGLMKTKDGLKILEFNCRFGDPETQVILPKLETDLLEIMDAVIDKRLSEITINWNDKKCVCVVLASKGYPEEYKKGYIITELPKNTKDIQIIHAGTKKENSILYTNGGRVLNVVSIDNNLKMAIENAYKQIENINFQDKYFRKDIGWKAFKEANP